MLAFAPPCPSFGPGPSVLKHALERHLERRGDSAAASATAHTCAERARVLRWTNLVTLRGPADTRPADTPHEPDEHCRRSPQSTRPVRLPPLLGAPLDAGAVPADVARGN